MNELAGNEASVNKASKRGDLYDIGVSHATEGQERASIELKGHEGLLPLVSAFCFRCCFSVSAERLP